MKNKIIDNKEGTLSFSWNSELNNYNVVMTDKHPLNTDGEGSGIFGGTVTHPDLIGYDCWISGGVSVIGECKLSGGTIIEASFLNIVNTNLNNCRISIYFGQVFESNLNNLEISTNKFDCKNFITADSSNFIASGYESLSIVDTTLLGNLMIRTSVDVNKNPNKTIILGSELDGNIMVRGLGFEIKNSRIKSRSTIISENYLKLNNVNE
jgi:hypothetical protein